METSRLDVLIIFEEYSLIPFDLRATNLAFQQVHDEGSLKTMIGQNMALVFDATNPSTLT